MKLAIAKEHRDFFQKQGIVEFTDFLKDEQIVALNAALNEALASRLNVSSEKVKLFSPEQVFLQGRDLWRSQENLRQFICQPRFAEVASELVQKKPIRLAYDQLFPARQTQPFGIKIKQNYTEFLEQQSTLEEVSCVKGVLCGLMVCLSDPLSELNPEEDEAVPPGVDIFPSKPGNVIYFQPTVSVNWNGLIQHAGQRYYLIVYSQAVAQYQLQAGDPHTHALKRLGYVFGDRLSDKLHPIVYR